ncbi:MAG: 6-phosphogluconolactonase [Phycisphaerales bacterium]|jgi:6-phosphogluconolactonase|nr:6-phosphogluconolactonase [Phycisphaerales bacterium]
MKTLCIALAFWSCIMTSTRTTVAATISVYLASPSKDQGGIFLAHLDTDTGKLSAPTRLVDSKTSFLALHPSKKFLFGVGEDEVRGFAVEPQSLKLTPLNEQSSGGRGPCYVTIDPAGKNALMVNYSGGTISVVPIKPDGTLATPSVVIEHIGKGPNPKRQDKPHPHSINLDPSGKLALVADLGLDQIKLYQFDPAAGMLESANPPFITTPPGGGPRHLDFHPNNKFLYVDNEMGCSVTAFEYLGDGNTKEIQTISTLTRPATDADTTSEIQVHPSGKFLYVANRGPNEIASFAIDESTGKLTVIGHTPTEGKVPRHFAIDPSGNWMLVANQNGDNVVVLKLDEKTGAVSSSGNAVELKQPMCVLFP